jgi:hypothetical protein
LGEHLLCKEGVRSSSLLGSTNSSFGVAAKWRAAVQSLAASIWRYGNSAAGTQRRNTTAP